MYANRGALYDKNTTIFKLQVRLILAKTLIFRAICPTAVLIVSNLAD